MIPKGLLHKLMPTAGADLFGTGDRSAIEYAAMQAVMEIEKKLGYQPTDVSAAKCGYDVESFIPQEMRDPKDPFTLRFVEVKGRAKGATTVTVTRNEILTGLNQPEKFVLAIVEVDGDKTRTVYLKEPFKGMQQPAFAEVSRNLSIQELIRGAEILYQE